MESVTYNEFTRKAGESFMVLLLIMGFCIFKLFKGGFNIEYLIIGISSLIGAIAIGRIGSIAKDALLLDNFKISKFDSELTGTTIILVLGVLSFYIFFVKGLYGFYQLFKTFTWFLLFFRLIIIVLSFRLVLAISKIQTVFKSVEKNDYSK